MDKPYKARVYGIDRTVDDWWTPFLRRALGDTYKFIEDLKTFHKYGTTNKRIKRVKCTLEIMAEEAGTKQGRSIDEWCRSMFGDSAVGFYRWAEGAVYAVTCIKSFVSNNTMCPALCSDCEALGKDWWRKGDSRNQIS